ncbi:MAG: DNA ligase D [Myxococcota bacterium]|nr:DNA ligase D [Myxococcota bacterium]
MANTTKSSTRKGGTERKPERKGREPTGTERNAEPGVGDRLGKYAAKRRFDITPEPSAREPSSQGAGKKEKKSSVVPAGATLAFVVQKHDARRLHYDVRLEVDGAMVSWAVPKGPSYDPTVRRLAVQTEDHPMAYNAFEGRIPDGEYGAGDVLIWDRGTYDTVPPGQQHAMLAKGHLHVRFSGEKLLGDWHLVRTSGRGGDDGAGGSGKAQWLFFKAKDAHANPAYDVVADRPESVASGRMATRGPLRVGASEHGRSAHALLDAVGEPALATSVTSIAEPSSWIFEVKYDGYRLLAAKAGDDVRLHTRRAHDWTARFAPIAEAVAQLGVRECVLDGEACALDDANRPSFAALQEWLAGGAQHARIAYAVFDLLWLDGRDMRREPIEVRRELLEKLLEGRFAPLSFSRAVPGALGDLLDAAKRAGLEGLVAKKTGSPYVAGRTAHWLKLRFDRRQDCVIAGYVAMAGAPDQIGALLLAVTENGALVYAGRVGTGFDARTRSALAKRLDADRVEQPVVERAPPTKDAHWVRPTLVCECAFTDWTREGSMRHPRYLGLREDKMASEAVREQADRPEPPVATPARRLTPPERTRGATSTHRSGVAAPTELVTGHYAPKLANPGKVLFPRDGLTKRDVWDYYTAIAPAMLPHLSGRPLSLQRYPDGIEGEEWYQQNAPDKTPAYVRVVNAGARHDYKKRIVCDNVETLQWLTNLAALTLHTWSSHAPARLTTRAAIDEALAQPNYVVLDLDPGDGPWAHLIEVASAVHALLDAVHLASFVKTSGKRGIHVLVPIAVGPTHDEATAFAERVARAVSTVLPKIATVERMKDKRGGKLYVDFGQNGEGRTIVAPYTIRARDGGVVSTPIEWDEVTEALDPTKFTVRSVIDRVRSKGDLFAGVLGGAQRLPG